MSSKTPTGFDSLGLNPSLLKALSKLGYEQPSPIQAQTIPLLLKGRDVVGMAQTGTGKTAAFALPILSTIDVKQRSTQALVLAPTRELAIQVAEAFQQYGSQNKGFHVLPIYGGQDYRTQLRGLNRGAHVVVGTPGRVIDHLKRGSLKLGDLKTLVLDEADEMLRMGFIDDVEWILEQTPEQRQVVLFSATMPPAIRRVADRYLSNVEEVRIAAKTATAPNIDQSYWFVRGMHKLDALTRILEVEDFDGVLIFVRTKNATQELADKIEARGHSATAINGDMNQAARERVINQLKRSKIDIVVATDVAARGIDVDRISHVINYDIPTDNEAYVHRIGRTGRAGRAGKAILFVAPREKHLLHSIERTAKLKIPEMQLPGGKEVGERRVNRVKEQIAEVFEGPQLDFFAELVENIAAEQQRSVTEVAAALLWMQQRDRPLQVKESPKVAPRDRKQADSKRPREHDSERSRPTRPDQDFPKIRYRLEVGSVHGAKVSDIVGAIANEAGIDNQYIGRIKIFDDHSTIELPEGMPKEIYQHLKRVRVRQQPIRLREIGQTDSYAARPKDQSDRPSKAKKGHGKSGHGKPGPSKPSKHKTGAPKKASKPGKRKFGKADGGNSSFKQADKPGAGKRKPKPLKKNRARVTGSKPSSKGGGKGK